MAEKILPPEPTPVLLAMAPEFAERFERLLTGHRVTRVHTVEEAERALRANGFELVVIGVAFDESRMFDLLGHIRADASCRSVPVLCVLGSRGRMSDVAVQAIDRAAKALMANAFVSLEKFADNDAGNARLRRIVDYLILIDGDMHQSLKEA